MNYKQFGRIEVREKLMTLYASKDDPKDNSELRFEVPDVDVRVGDNISVGDTMMTVSFVSHSFIPSGDNHEYHKYVECVLKKKG